jgi:hypothetical protein
MNNKRKMKKKCINKLYYKIIRKEKQKKNPVPPKTNKNPNQQTIKSGVHMILNKRIHIHLTGGN